MGEAAWTAGDVITGRYQLEAEIGRGGMGTVWRARHLTLDSLVAVKQIDPSWLDTEVAVARFLREAKTVASLRSPHVVQVFDHGVEGKIPFIVMELLEGESLAHRLAQAGRLTPRETARLIGHIGRALTKAHAAGIVHRDLKPENVFLVANEDEEIAKVIDFGIAKVQAGSGAPASVHTSAETLIGTPHYMSPEQARGRTVDHRSDLWSLGVIAYECLCGKRPFAGDSLGDLILSICSDTIPKLSAHALPEALDPWLARALRRRPEDRFQSAREQVDAFKQALGLTDPDASGRVDIPSAQNLDLLAPTLVVGDATSAPTVVDSGAVSAISAPLTLSGVQRENRKAAAEAESTTQAGVSRKAAARWRVLAVSAALLVAAALGLVALTHRSPAPRPEESGAAANQPPSARPLTQEVPKPPSAALVVSDGAAPAASAAPAIPSVAPPDRKRLRAGPPKQEKRHVDTPTATAPPLAPPSPTTATPSPKKDPLGF